MNLREHISDQQKQLLLKHLELVIEVNKSLNLTRIKTIDDGKLLHIEDSLSALPEIKDAPDGPYADLGSGGGFPGIPLAIMTGRETLLVDSVKKKMAALDHIISELELSNVHTYDGRIEELSKNRPEEFSVVTARALTALPSLLELASPLLRENGVLVCYKAQMVEDEATWGKSIAQKLGFTLESERTFFLSDKKTQRTILAFRKDAKSEISLPRKTGLAQKRPLK